MILDINNDSVQLSTTPVAEIPFYIGIVCALYRNS